MMNKTKLKFTTILHISLLISLSVGHNTKAQNITAEQKSNQTNYPHIEWVKTWPSSDKKHQTKSFKDQLNSILFGTKPPILSNPVSVFALNPEEFWIIDQGNKTVFHVTKDMGEIPQFFSKTDFDMSSLVGICPDSNAGIIFSDSHAKKIYRISPGKKKIQVLNDTLVLEQPTGIAFSPLKKEIWVVETKAHRITVLSESGEVIRRIGRRGNGPGDFNYPTHIWIDGKGFVYITDAMNFRIQVLNAEGEVISVFGEAGDATGYNARPKGIATDSFGNIYVVDALFHVVQVFDIKGNLLYKFGSQGHKDAEFWMPTGIYIDSRDYIYVADSYNSRVQVFQLIHTETK